MPRGPALRLFVACYPPPEVAAALLSRLAPLDLPPPPATRFTAEDQVHLTLQFIGDTHPRELRGVIESVERSCAGLPPFSVTPRRLVTIPDAPLTAPPRLVAAETDADATMLEVQRRLATRLARPKRSGKPERFHPHLTLCRFAEGTRRPASGHWTAPLPPEGMMFHVEQVWLMSSELRASGARHERVHGVRLG